MASTGYSGQRLLSPIKRAGARGRGGGPGMRFQQRGNIVLRAEVGGAVFSSGLVKVEKCGD